jgi:hypothetical protein
LDASNKTTLCTSSGKAKPLRAKATLVNKGDVSVAVSLPTGSIILEPDSVVLERSAKKEVTFVCQPSALDRMMDTFKLLTNPPLAEEVVLKYEILAKKAEMSVVRHIDFGRIRPGEKMHREFSVKNDGTV